MVTLATYKLEIDWDADDIYDGGTEDVTSDVRNIFWRRGKDHNSQLVGRWVSLDAQVTLKNDSGQYSSYATSNIKPGRKVRLNATDASGEVNLWEGKVENIIPRPSPFGLDVVEIDVIGWLGYIGDTEIDVEMQTSIRTDQAISEVLDAAGLPKLYNNQVLDDSPVGYWRFGEASGDAQDQTANNNDGTVTGVTYGSTTLLIGDTTTSFEFDGVTGNVNLGSPPELDDVFSGGGSVEAWIFADNDGEGGGGRIYDKNDWVLAVIDESAGEMKLNFRHQFSGANAEWATTSRVIGQSTHHVVVVYNRDDVANNPTIYVDGASVAVTETTTPVGVASSDAGSDLYVGNRLADDATFDGHIQEAAMYSTELTALKVKQHHVAGRAGHRDLTAGQTTMTRWFTGQNRARLALRDIQDTELGNLFEARTGKVTFDDRHGRLDATHQTSQATFSDALAASLPFNTIGQEDPLPFIFNKATVPVQLYTVGSLAVLWTLSEVGSGVAKKIEPGATRTYIARYPTLDSATNAAAVDAWTTPVSTTDYTFNSQDDGLGTDVTSDMTIAVVKSANKMEISVTNGHASLDAYPTLLQARGTPLASDDVVEVMAEDTDSQRDYGIRTFPLPPVFVPDIPEATDWANFIVSTSKDPIPLFRIGFLASRDATALDKALRLNVNDRITLTANSSRTNLGVNTDFFIEREEHHIGPDRIHRVAYTISEAEQFSDFWVWGYSKWGTTTRWAY